MFKCLAMASLNACFTTTLAHPPCCIMIFLLNSELGMHKAIFNHLNSNLVIENRCGKIMVIGVLCEAECCLIVSCSDLARFGKEPQGRHVGGRGAKHVTHIKYSGGTHFENIHFWHSSLQISFSNTDKFGGRSIPGRLQIKISEIVVSFCNFLWREVFLQKRAERRA